MKEGQFLGGWRPRSVALFGAGQVGTMIGLALRQRAASDRIMVCDPDPEALDASRARGLAPDAVLDPDRPKEAVEADVVVLAAPVAQIVELVGGLGSRLRPHTLLIDTGGAKSVVVEAMRRLPANAHAIGGHPMAGTEVPGAGGARPELLVEAPFILTPVRHDPIALARGRAFASALGSRPVTVSAQDHDRIVARTSHLPHVAAFALARVAAEAGEPGAVADLTGTGLQRATRLAASDPGMVAAFLSANAGEVRAAMADLRRAMARIEEALDGGARPLSEVLAEAGRVQDVRAS